MSEDISKEEVEIPPAEEKAESSSSNWFSQGSAWGASFLNTAREKTLTTLDLVKKDLNDLGEAVSSEMNDLASAAKEGFGTAVTAAKQQAQMLEKLVTPTEEEKPLPGEVEIEKNEKESSSGLPSSISFGWMSKIVDSVTDTVKNLAMEETTHEEANFTEEIKPKQIRKTNISQVKLTQIQTNEATYLEEPEKSEFYERWLNRFNLDEYDGEINILLANNPALRQMFGKLVPSQITYDQFWGRYFFAIEYADVEDEMNKSTLSEQLNIDVSESNNKRKRNKKNKKKQEDSSPSSDGSAVIVNEPTSPSQSEWSVCSEKNVEELPSNDEEEEAPLTPKPKDDKKSAKKEDGWVDWDE